MPVTDLGRPSISCLHQYLSFVQTGLAVTPKLYENKVVSLNLHMQLTPYSKSINYARLYKLSSKVYVIKAEVGDVISLSVPQTLTTPSLPGSVVVQ